MTKLDFSFKKKSTTPLSFISHFLPEVYHLAVSVHHLLSLEPLDEKPLERNWPSSLLVSAGYSRIKLVHPPRCDKDGRPLHLEGDCLGVKYLSELHLSLGNCVQRRLCTVKCIYMLERERQRQLNVDHCCRWWQMGSFLISYAVMSCFLGCVMKIKHRNCIDFYWNLKKKN